MTMILAIDPGLSGAYAVLWPDPARCPQVASMPCIGQDVHPLGILGAIEPLLDGGPLAIVLEAQQAMPGQGVASTFRIGLNYGLLLGTLMHAASLHPGWSLHIVRAAAWKRAMRLSKDKEQSRQLALLRWPQLAPQLARKKDEARAEALLLGAYWQEEHR